MSYYIVYVGVELFLYLAILKIVEKGPYKGTKGQKCLLFFASWIAMVCVKNIKMREGITLIISMMFLFLYLSIFLAEKRNHMYRFSIAMATIALNMIISVALAIPCSYIWYLNQGKLAVPVRDIMILLVKAFCGIGIYALKRRLTLYKFFQNRGVRILSMGIAMFLIIMEQIGLHLFDNNNHSFSIIFGNFLIFSIIIGILWLLDHYRLAAGKLKVEQDNRRMNTSLHKTKELMPLLISVVNENEGLLDPQLVEEFNQIYSEQMIAGRKDSMNYKLLGTTGIKLLDAQLQHYILECNKKGIVMDVFASEPIAKQIHEMGIAQLMVHNVVGDLLRNAIRAITRDGRTDGKILVIVGKKNETVEIDIFDNGANLPLEVLERFGTRGVTTGGTGNGLADLVEMLTAENISLVIRENAGENSTYTKGFLLVFDGKNRRELITWRADEPALRQNDYWDIKELTE